MCTPIVVQFRLLENLLAALASGSPVHIHVLQESQTTTSNTLVRKALKISVDVQAVVPGNKILSWHYPVDEFSFYTGAGNGRSPEQERYEQAWEQAETLKEALVVKITGLIVQTDGIIELPVRALISGTTTLVQLNPASGVGSQQPAQALVVGN
jgi:hypothetical protein